MFNKKELKLIQKALAIASLRRERAGIKKEIEGMEALLEKIEVLMSE